MKDIEYFQHQPRRSIQTERLLLKPVCQEDAKSIKYICDNKKVASTTALIPHPYTIQDAQKWIKESIDGYSNCTKINFKVTLKETHELIGATGFIPFYDLNEMELWFWYGADYWGNSYCTEASKAMLEYGFGELESNRISGYHLTRNPASGRVLQKIGLYFNSKHIEDFEKYGIWEDIDYYTLPLSEYLKQQSIQTTSPHFQYV